MCCSLCPVPQRDKEAEGLKLGRYPDPAVSEDVQGIRFSSKMPVIGKKIPWEMENWMERRPAGSRYKSLYGQCEKAS